MFEERDEVRACVCVCVRVCARVCVVWPREARGCTGAVVYGSDPRVLCVSCLAHCSCSYRAGKGEAEERLAGMARVRQLWEFLFGSSEESLRRVGPRVGRPRDACSSVMLRESIYRNLVVQNLRFLIGF